MKKYLFAILLMILPILAKADAVEVNGIYYNLISKAQIAEVTSNPQKYAGEIVIPESITSGEVQYKVTTIAKSAFQYCNQLTSISIPSSITTIEKDAFDLCTSLSSVNISDISAWCKISFNSNPLLYAHRLFLNGVEVKDLIIPDNVSSINGAFSYCTSLLSVIIPSSVESVGDISFTDCTSLTNLTIQEGLNSIGDGAFQNCKSLTNLVIPNSVTFIGYGAFSGCTSLLSANIGSGVKTINPFTFRNCKSLASITLNCEEVSSFFEFGNNSAIKDVSFGDNVAKIIDNAFENCSGITSINFGANLKSIAKDAFKNCKNISSVNVSDLKNWCQIDFENTYANPIFYSKKISINGQEIKDLIIPDGVSSIGKYAFYLCYGLKSVKIPNSVENIGVDAFTNCEKLEAVYISNLKNWCSYSFNGVSNPLIYAEHLYINAEEVSELIIPDDVSSIGYGCFSMCKSIKSVKLGNGVAEIGENAFSNCINMTSVHLNDKLNTIGRGAFLNCASLNSINMPESVTSLNSYAFYGCEQLSSITIPLNIPKIEAYTFYGCKSLKSVVIGNKLSSIDNEAFNGCSSLNTITIGSSVKSIKDKAFASCKELSTVYCLAKSVPSTNSNVFQDSYISYATLHIPSGSIDSYKSSAPWKDFGSIIEIPKAKYKLSYIVDGEDYKSYEIEEGETITPEPAPTKEGYTFSGWSEIPQTMPAKDVTVTGTFTINKYKLTYKVDGEVYKEYDIEYSATITPEPAPTKEGYTFSGWSEIPETMPAHDVTITGTFTKNKQGGSCGDNVTWEYDEDTNTLTISGNGNMTEFPEGVAPWASIKNDIKSIVIKEGVSSIVTFSFLNCSNVTSVSIPESVSSIGNQAFYGCTKLESIKIPNGISCLNEYSFRDCASLTSVSIPNSVTVIGYGAFMGCTSLSSVKVPEGVTEFEKCAFYGCTSLTAFTIPTSVKIIGPGAFMDCSGLESIIIPVNTVNISNDAFSGCVSLVSLTVEENNSIYDSRQNCNAIIETSTNQLIRGCKKTVIPNSVLSIGHEAFGDCSLEEIIIPASIEEIGQGAFWSNKNLKNIYCHRKTVPNTDVSAFDKSNSSAILHVPSSAIDLYKSSFPWSSFANIVALPLSKEELLEKIEANINIMKSTEQSLQDAYNKTAKIEIFESGQLSSFAEAVRLNIADYDAVIAKLESLKEKLNNGESVTEEEIDNLKCEDLRTALLERLPAYEEYVRTTSFTSNEGGQINVGNINVKNETKNVSWFYSKAYISDPHADVYKSVGISVVPSDGYHIKSIVIDGNDYTSTTSYTGDGLQAKNFTATFEQDAKPTYKLSYIVDGETYKSYDLEEGTPITPEPAPTKEGYEFSGWSEIPSTMPANNVEITGSFKQIDYKVEDTTYEISGEGTVTIKGGDQKGSVEISGTVVINGQTYKVTAIAENAFTGNTQITSVTIPEGITSIGSNAFSGCVSLLVINIGKSITSIGNKAFANVGTSSSARTRGEGAFIVNCYAESVPQTATDAFENSPIATGTLLVNDNIVDAYKTTTPWSQFGKIQGFQEAAGIDAISIDNPNAHIYDMQGNRIDNLQNGVNIIRLEDGKTKKVIVK